MEDLKSQTSENLMKTILRLYREVFLKHNEIKYQIIDRENTCNNESDTDPISQTLEKKLDEVLVASYYKQLECIPAMLDFCYLYAVKLLSENKAPFVKLPHSEIKLRLVFSTLKPTGDTKIYEAFACVIKNKTIIILRKESPPFHLQYNLAIKDFFLEMNDTLPIIKNLINVLLAIPAEKLKIGSIVL